MSSGKASTVPKKASCVTVPSKVTKRKTSSPLSRVTRSLREKLLAKKVVAAENSISEDSAASSMSIPAMEPTQETIAKIEAWPLREVAPCSEAAEANSSCSESFVSDSHPTEGHMSMLIMSSRKTGVEMDMANRAANDMLLRGKEALEEASNIKREYKLIAIDCLQSLYETVLSLSDSRSRHLLNLEKERSRHAQELIRVERAHTKKIATLTEGLVRDFSHARTDIAGCLDETKAVKSWLQYETREPHSQIKKLIAGQECLKKDLEDLAERIQGIDRPTISDNSMQESMLVKLADLSRQLDENRRDIESLQINVEKAYTTTNRTLEVLESHPLPPLEETSEAVEEARQKEIREINTTLKELKQQIKIHTPPTHLSMPPLDLTEQLQPLTERLEAVSSEVRTMRELRQRTPPPAVSLEAELAAAEAASRIKPPQTYAQKVKERPPPRPNHTLIVSSTDPQKTGEKVIETIRVSLDLRTTGARVDRVRKARNQKVVLSCGTKEDLHLIQQQIQKNSTLKVEKAKVSNPLIRIRDVLSYHTDAEIVEHIRAQNMNLFQGIVGEDSTIRVRYRKKARNEHECHPVLEVSPVLHKRILEVEKIYIGLQRRPVEDQSPLVQCTKCLGFGHTRAICREKADLCSYCGEQHSWEKCPNRKIGAQPMCKNCLQAQPNMAIQAPAHTAFSFECPERQKWDTIARSRVAYC